MREITKIILHCSATPAGVDYDVNRIRGWHINPKDNTDGTVTYKGKKYPSRKHLPTDVQNLKGNGWSDIGYHYLIRLDGTVERGRDESMVGAHTVGQNSNSIGICYVGGVDANNKSKAVDTRTPEQTRAMDNLIHQLLTKYGPKVTVHGHNEFANKACPSFNVKIDNKRREAVQALLDKKPVIEPPQFPITRVGTSSSIYIYNSFPTNLCRI